MYSVGAQHAAPLLKPTDYPNPILHPTQLKQRNFRRHKHSQRHADYADSTTDVELARSLREVAHDILRNQAPGGPPNHGQIELAAVNVAGQRERNAARRGAVEGARSMRQQDPERLLEVKIGRA